MAGFTCEEIILATQGCLLVKGLEKSFTGVSTDTRKIRPGELFIPLVGEKYDGHDFIEQAVKNGASGIVISRKDIKVREGVTIFSVKDTLKALQDLARFHRLRFSIPVIAITGSNGKTTTKDMTAAILASRFHVLKTQGNFNNEVGLPLTLLQLDDSHDAAVVEMGMRGLGQIKELADIAMPTIAVVTNVSETHIELLGTLENIATAKGELVEAISQDGVVILNADNSYVARMKDKAKGSVVLYGLHQGLVIAKDIHVNDAALDFTCTTPEWTFKVHIPTVGEHNVYNALAGICVGRALGVTPQEVNEGLASFNGGNMRLQVEKIGDYTVINDAYNASPASMIAAIDALVQVAKDRKIVVLGDMLELGHVALEAHRRVGQKVADSKVDILVTVGQLSAHIVEAAAESGMTSVFACKTHEEAQMTLKKLILPGDTLLIKGSRGMKMENMLNLFV